MFEPKATAPHLDSTNRVALTACHSLPVYPRKPTCSRSVSMSQRRQKRQALSSMFWNQHISTT
jgi:hypothetical protein